MKSNAATLSNILSTQDELGYFLLVQLHLSDTYFYTTLPYEVLYNGNTYLSDACIIKVMPPTNTTIVNRSAYSIQLSGLEQAMINEINGHVINRKIVMRMGFTINGVPRLGLDDTIHVYSGYVAKPQYEVSGDTATITLELTSPLADLDSVSTLLTTKDSMKNLSPNDTSFDMIYEGSAVTNIKWGK